MIPRLLFLTLASLSFHAFAFSDDPVESAFTRIYDTKEWRVNVNDDTESDSGPGSSMTQTMVYRFFLQQFMKDYNIKTVVDFGCGDWTFSQAINWDGVQYTGYDVVKALIEKNKLKYGANNITFIHGNGVSVYLPPADLLICKDVLQHLPNEDIHKFFTQLSKYKYALITNDTILGNHDNVNCQAGGYRYLDILKPPFSIKGKKILSFKTDHRTKDVILIDNTK